MYCWWVLRMNLFLMPAQLLLCGRLHTAGGALVQQQPQVLGHQMLTHGALVRPPLVAHPTPPEPAFYTTTVPINVITTHTSTARQSLIVGSNDVLSF